MKVGLRGVQRKGFRKHIDFVVIPPVSLKRAREYAKYRVEYVIIPEGDKRHIAKLARILRAKVLESDNAPEGIETVRVERIYVKSVDRSLLSLKGKNSYIAFDGPQALRAALFLRYSLRDKV